MTAADICRLCRIHKVCCFQNNCKKLKARKGRIEEYSFRAAVRESHNRIERMCKMWNA